MYNKLFTKILDSSIWLESTTTRIVWITLLAAMDEDGFVPFASIGNVANRARVTDEEATEAIRTLESPDTVSPGQPLDGRRIERVPKGWLVINAKEHKALVTSAVAREQNRIRVQRFRERLNKSSNDSGVTGNTYALPSPLQNHYCNTSETETETETETKTDLDLENKLTSSALASFKGNSARANTSPQEDNEKRAAKLIENYAVWYSEHRNGAKLRLVGSPLDFQVACSLCETWDDYRLEKLAVCVLTTDDSYISGTDRAFKIFGMKASWADDRLSAWETEHGVKA